MKHFIKSLFAIMVLLLTTTSAWAEENENKFKITYLLNDVDQKNTTDKPGTVVCVINGTTATLTVTPKEGNYFETNGITVYKNINGINAQTRNDDAPDFNAPVKLSVSSSSLTGDTKFTFEVTDEKYEYEVYVNFKTRTSITGADITLDKEEYPYTGEEIKPTITKVELSDGTVLTTDDYTVKGYAYNTNVPKENDPAPKITITGTGKYKDEASTEFTIVKAEINPVVEIKGWIYGETANTPSIKKGGNPGGGEESFEYKKKDASDDKYTGDVPTNANTYIVKVTVAETDNYKDGTATAEFTISPKSIAKVTIKLNPESFVFNGEDQRPEVTSVTDNALDGVNLIPNKDYTLTYESGTNVGEYSVTITGMGNYDSETTASQKYNITALKTTPTVTLADTETPIVYDGTKKEPAVKVTVVLKDGADPTVLTTDDYDVAYSDNVNAGENTAKATVTLKRNYEGSAETTFTIKPKSIANVNIEDIADQTYTGEPIEPAVTVKDGEKTLTLNTDYTVSYSNNTAAALATAENAPTVTIKGKGNYDPSTTATKTFTIGKAEINPVVEIKGWIYGETANTPSIKEGGNPGKGKESFEYKEKGAGDNKYTGDVPTNANTYIVKATVAETDNYKGGTATAEFTISPKSIAKVTINLTPESFVFNGENQKPEVSVKDGETELVLNTDYTLTNEGGKNVNEYTVTVAGKGNYDSKTSVSRKYNITVLNTTPTVTLADTETPIVYDGTKKEPAVKVTVVLKEGADPTVLTTDDYDVVYSDNVNAGENTAKATVTLKGNYTGTNTASFTIKPKSIANVNIEDIADQTYTGEPIEPTVTVKDGEKTLTLNTDYTVSYSNNTAAALATAENAPTMTIKGKGNYDPSTTATKTFTIGKTQATLSFSEKAATATVGEDFTEPTLTKTPADITVTFTSSRQEIASVNDKTGEVTPLAEGETVIKATFAGNDNYEPVEASYTLTVNKGVGNGYPLWIGDVQVTEDNKSDVLGNGTERNPATFIFNPENNTLVITGETTPYEIETRLPELKIFLNEISNAKRIFYYNPSNPSSKGKLIFTQDPNFPGTLVLKTDNGNSVISGFSSVDYEYRLTVTDPDCTNYYDSELRTEEGARAQTATIGQGWINPLVKNELVTFPPGDFVGADLSNYAVRDILYTLNPYVDGEGYDDGKDYDTGTRAEEGSANAEEGSICFASTTTEDIVNVVAQNVEKGSYFPGSSAYASDYTGITFMVPGGEGKIKIDTEIKDGYLFHLKIGTDASNVITLDQRSVISIPYKVEVASYVYYYLVKRSKGDTRISKRDKAHGTIFSVKVSPSKSGSPNPVTEVTEDFPEDLAPEVVTDQGEDTTSITVISGERASDDKWYTIDGQQVTYPNKKGLYIQNGKKIVIR